MRELADVILGLLLVMLGVGLTLIGLYFKGYELPGHWGEGYMFAVWGLILAKIIVEHFAEIG